MLEFVKRFGLGLLYVILTPVFALIIVLFAIYGLFLFMFMAVKAGILFFTGRSVFDDLPEDIEAKRRLGKLVDEPLSAPGAKPTPKENEDIKEETKAAKPEKIADKPIDPTKIANDEIKAELEATQKAAAMDSPKSGDGK